MSNKANKYGVFYTHEREEVPGWEYYGDEEKPTEYIPTGGDIRDTIDSPTIEELRGIVEDKGFHYEQGEIECLDYLFDNLPKEAFEGGLEWNIKKYLHRWRYKDEPVKDLRKARDYLSALIEFRTTGEKPEFKEFK